MPANLRPRRRRNAGHYRTAEAFKMNFAAIILFSGTEDERKDWLAERNAVPVECLTKDRVRLPPVRAYVVDSPETAPHGQVGLTLVLNGWPGSLNGERFFDYCGPNVFEDELQILYAILLGGKKNPETGEIENVYRNPDENCAAKRADDVLEWEPDEHLFRLDISRNLKDVHLVAKYGTMAFPDVIIKVTWSYSIDYWVALPSIFDSLTDAQKLSLALHRTRELELYAKESWPADRRRNLKEGLRDHKPFEQLAALLSQHDDEAANALVALAEVTIPEDFFENDAVHDEPPELGAGEQILAEPVPLNPAILRGRAGYLDGHRNTKKVHSVGKTAYRWDGRQRRRKWY